MEVLAEEFGHPTSDDHHVDVPRSTQLKKFVLVITGLRRDAKFLTGRDCIDGTGFFVC